MWSRRSLVKLGEKGLVLVHIIYIFLASNGREEKLGTKFISSQMELPWICLKSLKEFAFEILDSTNHTHCVIKLTFNRKSIIYLFIPILLTLTFKIKCMYDGTLIWQPYHKSK